MKWKHRFVVISREICCVSWTHPNAPERATVMTMSTHRTLCCQTDICIETVNPSVLLRIMSDLSYK